MYNVIESLHHYLEELNDEFGGDIGFIPVIKNEKLEAFERSINWKLPALFRYFLMTESNGIVIGNKRIYSLFDDQQKKSFVDNLERNNDPAKSYWFKGRPQVFDDYLIIGADDQICFCYSKKYDLENPAVYICVDANAKAGVNLERLDVGLEGVIRTMIHEEFG